MARNNLRSRCRTPDEQTTARIVVCRSIKDSDELVDVLALTSRSRRTPCWVRLSFAS